jgi:hypothetical protein
MHLLSSALEVSNLKFHGLIKIARRERRKCERKWRNSKNMVNQEAYAISVKSVSKLIQKAKEVHYKDALESADSKTMYATLSNLLNKNTRQLPDADCMTSLSNSFARFFYT